MKSLNQSLPEPPQIGDLIGSKCVDIVDDISVSSTEKVKISFPP